MLMVVLKLLRFLELNFCFMSDSRVTLLHWDEKAKISHRARALTKLISWLKQQDV